MTHFKNKRMGPLLLMTMVFLIISMGSVHPFGAILLSNTVFGAFALHHPILYVLIGWFFAAGVLFKFKHVLGLLHRRKESR